MMICQIFINFLKCTFTIKHSYYGMSADLQAAPVMQVLSQIVTINFGSFRTPMVTTEPKYIEEAMTQTKP
jgi:hypothetical protein